MSTDTSAERALKFWDKQDQAGPAEASDKKHRITRDTFLFLTPHSDPQKEDFAQCEPCRMFVPDEYLKGKIDMDLCILHGSKVKVGEYFSCGFMAPWPTPNGTPVKKVIEDHAAELLKIIPGSVTAKESGLVDRRVQCHRCRFAEDGAKICGLYKMLNKTFPNIFDLDEKITPNSCCNAQEPR